MKKYLTTQNLSDTSINTKIIHAKLINVNRSSDVFIVNFDHISSVSIDFDHVIAGWVP